MNSTSLNTSNNNENLTSLTTPEGEYLLGSTVDILGRYKDCQLNSTHDNQTIRFSYYKGSSPHENCYCINSSKDIYFFNDFQNFGNIEKKILKSTVSDHCIKTDQKNSYLLVGYNSGEINIFNLHKRILLKSFNEEKTIERTSVTCVQWVPNSDREFIVGHSSGNLYLYQDFFANQASTLYFDNYHLNHFSVIFISKASKNPNQKWCIGSKIAHDHSKAKKERRISIFNKADSIKTHSVYSNLGELWGSCINKFRFSPNGKLLAIVTQDGYLRIYHFQNAQLIGFMRSYFGGLSCLDWSSDGNYIAVGGQDDLVHIYSISDFSVICRFRGHRSWITSVRFDHNFDQINLINQIVELKTYRLLSIGQDGIMLIWELSNDTIRQGINFAEHYEALLASSNNKIESFNNSQQLNSKLSPVKDLIRICQKNFALYRDNSNSTKSVVDLNSCSTLLNQKNALFDDKDVEIHFFDDLDKSSSLRKTLQFKCAIKKTHHQRKSLSLTTKEKISSPRFDSKSEDLCISNLDAGHEGVLLSSSPVKDSYLFPFLKYAMRTLPILSKHEDKQVKNVPGYLNSCQSSPLDYCNEMVHLQILRKSIICDSHIFGTTACPSLEDIPILEAICQQNSQDRFSDLLICLEAIYVVNQQGLVFSWKRPLEILAKLDKR